MTGPANPGLLPRATEPLGPPPCLNGNGELARARRGPPRFCKGGSGGPDLWMAKIKTRAYLARLKAAFADRWEDYWE